MRLFLTLFFSAFLFIRLTAQKPDSSSVIYLTPEQFREELSILSNPLIIDVREFFEYRRSRLNDAINIPSSGSIEIPADTIDKSRHLFLYCTSGFRSKRVAEKFIEKGFKHVYSLDGG
ncbi:MAG TPA: rhodanese-like domain-containing protein, partial [Bacteroidales bacterium]|nr:rhodanese-like domain-containing protein [Bacteroidales bacterium]